MHYFDTFPLKSRIRKVHPVFKLGLFLLCTIMAISTTSIVFLVITSVVFLFLTLYTARISVFRLLRLMLIPVSFILIGSLSVMVEMNPLGICWKIGIPKYYFGISLQGLMGGVLIFARSISSVSILYCLVLNTSISDIVYILGKMKVPDVILDLLVLVYRNIFIFLDKSQCILESQKSRLGYRNFKSTLRSTAQLAGNVFVLSGVQAEQMLRSMESRGYNGKMNTLQSEWKTDRKWLIFMVVMCLFFLGFVFLTVHL